MTRRLGWRIGWRIGTGTIALAALGCSRTSDVARTDWGMIPQQANVHVRTVGGAAYDLRALRFTTRELVAWGGQQTEPTRSALADTIRIPLDSLAVVRIRRLDPQRTSLLVAGAMLGAYILIAQSESDVQPEQAESCPFVYSFDGARYVFDSETYAGAIARGLERTDLDNLEHLRPDGERYRLLLTNERNETHYTDEVTLLVADHPRGTRVFPDAAGAAHIVGPGTAPTSLGELTADTLPARVGWEAVFPRPVGASRVALVVRARNTNVAPFALDRILTLLGPDVYRWYGAVDRDGAERDRVRSWIRAEGHLEVRIEGVDGWRTAGALPDVGPAIAKSQVVALDLANVPGDSIRVRLESSPMLWTLERVELAAYHGTATTVAAPLAMARANGREDSRDALAHQDGRYHVALRGDTVRLEYVVPAAPRDLMRTTLVRTTGHYYIAADDRGPRRGDIVTRLMNDRAFAQRYLIGAWQERAR